MLEKRRFRRVRFTAPSDLIHNDISYRGQIENISLNGALLSFSDGVIIPQDEKCALIVWPDEENPLLRMEVKVIYANFTMIGIKFVSMDEGTHDRLYNLMAELGGEPGKLTMERKILELEEE